MSWPGVAVALLLASLRHVVCWLAVAPALWLASAAVWLALAAAGLAWRLAAWWRAALDGALSYLPPPGDKPK